MSNDNTKSSLAFFLSILIHTLLAVAVVYTGLDMTLPEGTVTSTEVVYTEAPIPQGSQTEDTAQIADHVAETKPAPPPPAPAPKPVVLPPAKVADTESESDIVAPEEPQEIEPEVVEPADPEISEENLNPPADTNAANEEKEQPLADESINQEVQEENPVDGQSANNEAAYGTSTGVQSDSNLSPVPGNKNPDYPMWARLRRQEGVTVVQFEVLEDGSVANTRVTQSSGFEALDASAVKAHEKWRYRPGKTGTFTKSYNFKLTGQAEEIPSQLRRGK